MFTTPPPPTLTPEAGQRSTRIPSFLLCFHSLAFLQLFVYLFFRVVLTSAALFMIFIYDFCLKLFFVPDFKVSKKPAELCCPVSTPEPQKVPKTSQQKIKRLKL